MWLSSVALAGAGTNGCTQQDLNIHTATNPAASFEQYRTFSFGPAEGPPSGYQTSARVAEVRRRVLPLIAAVLTVKGYARAEGKGDFFVMYGSGTREVSLRDVSSASQEWLPDDESQDFVEGSLVVDAFESSSGVRIWHGASRAQIDPDHIDDALLGRAVTHLLASFPSAAGRTE